MRMNQHGWALFRTQTKPLSALLAVALVLLVVPPVIILIQRSVSITNADSSMGGYTLGYFIRLFTDPDLAVSIWNSAIFSVFSTLVALLFGGTLAWLVERTDTRFKMLAYLTTITSMGTPYILYVSSWLFLLGRSGPFNSSYRALTGTRDQLIDPYSIWGMILIEGFLWSPLVFLLLAPTFRVANADMEEAARMSGASVLQTVWHISMKMAKPAILALSLFVFIRAIEAFEVPAIVGMPGGVNVLTTDVYKSLRETIPPDLGFASAYSVVLLAIVSVLLFYYTRLSKNAARYSSVTGKGFRPRPFELGKYRWVGSALVLFNFCIVLLLPILALLWLSVLPYMRGFSPAAFPQMSLENYATVLRSDYYRELAMNTVVVGASTATAVMGFTFLVGWLSARRYWGGQVLDFLTTIPLIFPGIVMGVAFLMIFLRLPLPVYGTAIALIIAYSVRYLPYGLRYTYTGVLQIHRELEEAANVAGATSLGTLRRIIAPILSPALLSGWLFVFLLATKELAVAVLIAGTQSQVVAIGMFDLWINGQGGELAAFGLVWAGAMSLIAWLFYAIVKHQNARTADA